MATYRERRWRSSISPSAIYEISERPQLVDLIAAVDPSIVVVDVEPLLVGWGEPEHMLSIRLDSLAESIRPSARVVVCTNSRRFRLIQGAEMIANARKPRVPPELTGDLGGRPLVVGDLLILDGLLARRLRADFVWWRGKDPAPWWPRLLRMVDAVARRLCTREVVNAH